MPDLERFAKLIIKECITIIDERKPIMANRIELWDQINKHFGVE
jgi:hypothetical protein